MIGCLQASALEWQPQSVITPPHPPRRQLRMISPGQRLGRFRLETAESLVEELLLMMKWKKSECVLEELAMSLSRQELPTGLAISREVVPGWKEY